MNQTDYDKDFNLDKQLIHVNHAAVAPWPLRTQIAVQAFAEENTRQSSVNYLQWMEHEANLRELLRKLINA
ncbi:MAG: aminotransferase, partial [Gammaproteobacteria bacterium]|nr:aminotransferase [Gammaproteobacteria bacterium]